VQTRRETPLYVPAEWAPKRDIALDLLRGLAMVILVVNHTALESPLRDATRAVLSAAEVLVMVSGVVVGMVFGRRWLLHGARATSAMLLRRARKLYFASVVVVALVGLATLVPGLPTEALTVSPRLPVDTYAFDGALRVLVAIVTLEAGPWQFNILGFFIAVLAAAPLVLRALERGRWRLVLGVSLALYLLGRAWSVDVLPSQSERAFPLPIWQLLFVWGMVLGWHRDAVARWIRPRRGWVLAAVAAVAATLAGARLMVGDDVELAHFHKGSLDPLRILLMASVAAVMYVALDRFGGPLRAMLLPLGRNSFYVFIMHVFLCLAIAGLPAMAPAANVLVQVACLALLCLMVRRRFLFRWVPR
jgi:hypothetical protein